MDKCGIASVLLLVAGASVPSAASANSAVFSEATLERALEGGCSLVVAEILSTWEEGTACHFKARIVRTIVAGDLEKEDVQNPWELSADSSCRDALKPSFSYALFVRRDCPYGFTWVFADDVIEIDPSDKEAVRRLTAAADRVYAETSILRFRRGWPWPFNELPALPDELASLCKEFRHRRRSEIGRKICASDLGSRIDDSRSEPGAPAYLPPRISCSRRQMVSLLGYYPTVKSGWTYSWCCGEPASAAGKEQEVGVIRVTFDGNDRAIRVLYEMQACSKWLRRMTPVERLAQIDGDPASVAGAFQQAVKTSDWDRALSYCSQPVRAKAAEFDSPRAFFQCLVPLKEIPLRPFSPNLFSSRDGRIIRMSDDVGLYVEGEEDWWPRWPWSLVRVDKGWLVDFELLSREDFLQKARIKRELLKRGQTAEPGEFDKAIKYVLTPISDEFVIGRPMRFRLEMTNTADKPFGYWRMDVMANDPMIVTDPNGQMLPYVDTGYQLDMGSDAILPGETIVLAEEYDVTSQYRILRPGSYTFQFKLYDRRSNVCSVEVKPGPLPQMEQIVEKLLPVLPSGWRLTRSLRPPSGFREDRPTQSLCIELIGKPGGKGNRYGISLLVLLNSDPLDTDPWLKEWYDFWGLTSWGSLYARVNEVEQLWPDHRVQIERALGVEPAE